MKEQLEQLQREALQEIETASSQKTLNDVRIKYLGKKGPMTEVLRGMGKLSAEERPVVGELANTVRTTIQEVLEARIEDVKAVELEAKLAAETIDVTLPGRTALPGHSHLLQQIVDEMEDLFVGLGYTIAEGPEVETDLYNFEMLNLPKDHPARDMQDSFYITDETLLRTHTSPVQARTMLDADGKPIRIICPGKVYRRDEDDATHSHQFMQIEGLVVDEHISMADLKGTLEVFVKQLFGETREIRLRPSFFPFTEPSVEVDISCFKCGGKGCNVCKGTGWIEILGGGMVHPRVLEMAGYDATKMSGFAFGIGVERMAMLKHGVDDIRHFYTNDLRFIEQF
ncbi:phenylalanine--tRNA ligase subunit alpha [Exiguobacterium sp. SH3S2]|uniref:phenylalanine--tRNA ligase subunit alpha n=1 Tax=unclassified Exiguobacterium TaxID=2644629 RepID=UPI001038AC2F|nr:MULTISPECIES: phenylalanine--tRNA ligase subunit alpha [unclassified Exiguobacterium]TCI25660.1 phenylalanine--tRNA ligase subunit alpha [Exiguobacterium sp. SH5S4]TCI48769.1 phenylalanine--tRNA ligase subunit alpha [Exiguobacterium sp. SH3S3]TCI55666.1 phenylalanine--tRNA ligase subunit alpha [Exiguobacterium sp. SH5S13]TCI63634.1 phenylalanine--tRNA ligase subunit alpha [Exiguobacterium sp. SH3S2]TCI64757.1 phenylalanine--tRNA ligase subunit alpha [Exiguobacterium sp. SH3S1]